MLLNRTCEYVKMMAGLIFLSMFLSAAIIVPYISEDPTINALIIGGVLGSLIFIDLQRKK